MKEDGMSVLQSYTDISQIKISMKIIVKNRVVKFIMSITERTVKFMFLFGVFSFVLFFLGCSLFQSNKKTKMVEPPPYYQQHGQHHEQHHGQHYDNKQHNYVNDQQKFNSANSNTPAIDDSKVFHRNNNEIVNVKIFRDTELEKLQRESVALENMQTTNTQPKKADQKVAKQSWFASWFGRKDESKNKNSKSNTPYLMSEKAKEINSNLQ